MATCTLRIGDRIALASLGGAPEVEYALFDPGAIELAAAGPGMVQEVGYQTTAGEAIQRLKEGGVTWPRVLETAAAMQPTVAMAYARGPAIRRIATSLGAAELFDGFRYDATTKTYEGRWLDLPALALDAGVPRLASTLQSMHLLSLLLEVNPDDPVHLVTREHMANARSGGRSYKRYTFEPITELPAAIRTFANDLRSSPPHERVERTEGPNAADLLDTLRDRIILLPDAESQDRLRAIEKAIGIRQRPMRGPLADPQLWALEEQLSSGRFEGVSELVDAIEKASGKQPATAYLRLRAALIAGREPPKAIAERIASLALTMPSFVELELLAAEAWNAAGDPKRALPFARDLISNAVVNDELRVRESQQFSMRRPSHGSMDAVRDPSRTSSLPSAPSHALTPERVKVPTPPPPAATSNAGDRPALSPGMMERETMELESTQATQATVRRGTQPHGTPPVVPNAPPILPNTGPLKPRPSAPPPMPAPRPPASSRKDTPPMVFGVTDKAPPPVVAQPVPTTRSPALFAKRPISGTWVGPPPGAKPAAASHPTQMHFGAVPPPEPPSDRPPPLRLDESRSATPRPEGAPSTRKTSRPQAEAPRLANRTTSDLMRGASQPPFRSDSPDAHAHVPKAPPVPQFANEPETASSLSLPEGLRGVPDPVEALPRTVLDARVQFTFLSRELGREYEENLGLTLTADISGVEAMQRVLLERYGNRQVTTPEAAADVRRHGAFLSEILARTFSAFWVDIGPNDVGYWAMVVPPGTRVWPFGRILRLIALQHNERDLVSYFLELQGRAARG